MNKLAVAKLPTKGCSSARLDGVSEPNRRFTLKQYTNPPWHGVFAGEDKNRRPLKMLTSRKSTPAEQSHRHSRWLWLLMAACGLVVLIAIFRSPHRQDSLPAAGPASAAGSRETWVHSTTGRARSSSHSSRPSPAPTAEEVVAAKVVQFGRNRREIAQAIGRRANRAVPPEVEKFFDAVEAGQWEEIKTEFDALAKRSGQYEHSTHSPDLDLFWPALLDAYGVAEQAHLWPAQKLLDYGEAVLASLRPGMVYVGGTDNGRWIPELLNETSQGEQHIIVTQNALADARYLDYVGTLYGDRMVTLTPEDSQRAFQEYMADAQKRLEHDQKFPNEPKQVRPGEDIRAVDGKAQVSGQAAVMAINEKLLQTLMAKNPGLSFTLQESFPLKGTYADALPLGPLMELHGQDGQNPFTVERAAQSLDYWRNTAQQILSDPEATGSPDVLKSYSHDAVSAANLLAAHSFYSEAEQAYRLATQLWPGNPESIAGLAELLASGGREDEAGQILEDFARKYPDQRKDLERVRAAWRFVGPAQAPQP